MLTLPTVFAASSADDERPDPQTYRAPHLPCSCRRDEAEFVQRLSLDILDLLKAGFKFEEGWFEKEKKGHVHGSKFWSMDQILLGCVVRHFNTSGVRLLGAPPSLAGFVLRVPPRLSRSAPRVCVAPL